VSAQGDHRRYEEDLAAYLLDALDQEERQAFERHLRSCPACQAEERWLRGAVELLPSSVEQLEPPPALRERLMDTVRAEAGADGVEPRRPGRRRARFGFVLRPAAVFAAAALIAVGVGAGYLIGNGGGGSKQTVATVPAQPTGVALAARGEIVKSRDAAVIRVSGLRPRHGRVYQLWLVRKGSRRPEPSSLFEVARDGSGASGIPGGLEGVRVVMVSSEPEGGSRQPTSRPVLRATL
jgi:anti-sigma-K factor RskA